MRLGSWYALMVDTVTLDRDIGQKNARAIFPAAKIIPQATSRSNRLTVHHGFAAF